jgi:hypothetical protein
LDWSSVKIKQALIIRNPKSLQGNVVYRRLPTLQTRFVTIETYNQLEILDYWRSQLFQ